MSLFVTSLNSGSNGNCYYIGNETEAVLIDAGITCKEIEKRMLRLGLTMQKVKAIFVSHEHTDHIKGIMVLAKKYQLPVYITTDTLISGALILEEHLIKPFTGYTPITIGSLTITAFPKFHDAAEPHSFIVSNKQITVGIFTDIGVTCEHLIHHFRQCHAAFLEANYDEQMLASGKYPYYLKKRITGGHGHLSNKQALALFTQHKPAYMSHLFLAHLSKENNCPKLVEELFAEHAGDTKIIIASRYEETPLYYIEYNGAKPLAKPIARRLVQATLF